jgi:hypothetical protein
MDLDVIRRITIQARTEGVDAAGASVKALSDQYAGLASASEKSERANKSVAGSFEALQSRLDQTYRAQKNFEGDVKTLAQAQAQGLVSQDRSNQLLGLATARYQQVAGAASSASLASRAFTAATSGVSGQLTAIAAGAGPVGTFLASLGPVGFVAAAGLGVVETVISAVSSGAERMGEKAIAVRQFSDVTGLAASQFGVLRKSAADAGVDGDRVAVAFERLTGNLDETSRGAGQLYADLRRVDTTLADQVATAPTVTAKIDTLAKAWKAAGDESARAAIGIAAFGRGGGAIAAATLGPIADAGGINNLKNGMDELGASSDEQIRRWATMQAQIDALNSRARNILASIFTEEGLSAARLAAEQAERVARALKIAKENGSLGQQGAVGALGGVGADAPVPQTAPEVAKQAAAGWAQYDAAMAGAVQSSAGLVTTQQQIKNETIKTANDMQAVTGALGSAASAQDVFNTKIAQANALLAGGVLKSQEQVNRAIQAANPDNELRSLQRQQGVLGEINRGDQIRAATAAKIADLNDKTGDRSVEIAQAKQQEANEFTKIETSARGALASLRNQEPVAAAVTGQAKLAAQAEATYNDLVRQGVSSSTAAAISDQQRANSQAQISASAQLTIAALRDQEASAGAITGAQKAQADAQATFNKLIREGASVQQAEAAATQVEVNARVAANAAIEREIYNNTKQIELIQAAKDGTTAKVKAEQAYNDALRAGADLLHAQAIEESTLALETQKAADAENAKNKAKGDGQNIPSASPEFVQAITSAFGKPGEGGAGNVYFDTNGNLIFTKQGALNNQKQNLTAQYGAGNFTFDDQTGEAHLTGQYVANQGFKKTGSTEGAIQTLLTGFDFEREKDIVSQLIATLPEEEQGQYLQATLSATQAMPQTVDTVVYIKQLTDSIKNLAKATDQNTTATVAMTDVLSPLYTSDPRHSNLGFRPFAGGGIMTEWGPLPLQKYSGGGVAFTPQAAVFGENYTPEAFIPAPNGRVPVALQMNGGGANDNRRPIMVNIPVTILGNASAETVDRFRRAGFQIAQDARRGMAA